MTIIRLTMENGGVVYVNVAQITHFFRTEGETLTSLYFVSDSDNDAGIEVTEDPEVILRKIKIKEAQNEQQ